MPLEIFINLSTSSVPENSHLGLISLLLITVVYSVVGSATIKAIRNRKKRDIRTKDIEKE